MIKKTKTLMVLTAGYWQKPIIQCAKKLGLYVIATDASLNPPAAKFADEFIRVDALDIQALVRVARERNISGVIAEQTDAAVLSAASVAEECQLPGIGIEVAKRATNKKLMRDACARVGIPMPNYRCVQNIDDAIVAINEIGFPVVIKPTDSQSSKGVTKIWNIEDVHIGFSNAFKESREGRVLIEEMLTGIESSVESYVTRDKVIIMAISEKTKSLPPYSYDTKVTYPANFSNSIMQELERVNNAVIEAIGIPFGNAHAEYIITPKGVFLLEIAARGCGAGVSSLLIPAMTNFDPIKVRIQAAIGAAEDRVHITNARYGLLEFLMLKPGKIKAISGVSKARDIEGVIALDYFVNPGDRIEGIHNGAQRPGYCLAVGENDIELGQIIDQVKSTIKIEII